MPLRDDVFRAWIDEAERHSRFVDYETFENYYLGNFDDIPLPKHIADALGVDVATHVNFSKTIIDTKVQYICGGPIAITVLSTPETKERAKEAEQYLIQVYKNNRLLFHNYLKANRILAKKGDVFLKAFWDEDEPDEDKRLKVRVIKPENGFPKYKTDDYEEMELCALKYFEFDENGDKQHLAQVWYPDVLQGWVLSSADGSTDENDDPDEMDHEWKLDVEDTNDFGLIPVVHIPNIIDDREFGISDISPMTELQNAMNKTMTDFLLNMDYQAFTRLFIIGAQMKPGVQIDVSPGAAHMLPNSDAKVTVVEASDMQPFINAIDKVKQLICEVTQTPQIALGTIEGGIPSGYALKIHYQPLENKAQETKSLLQEAFQQLNRIIFAIAKANGVADYTDLETTLTFVPGLPIDQQNIVVTHTAQLANKTLSTETAMQEEGVEDVDAEKAKIAAEEIDLFGGIDRVAAETAALQESLAGVDFFSEAAPAEVTAAEVAADAGTIEEAIG